MNRRFRVVFGNVEGEVIASRFTDGGGRPLATHTQAETVATIKREQGWQWVEIREVGVQS